MVRIFIFIYFYLLSDRLQPSYLYLHSSDDDIKTYIRVINIKKILFGMSEWTNKGYIPTYVYTYILWCVTYRHNTSAVLWLLQLTFLYTICVWFIKWYKIAACNPFDTWLSYCLSNILYSNQHFSLLWYGWGFTCAVAVLCIF